MGCPFFIRSGRAHDPQSVQFHLAHHAELEFHVGSRSAGQSSFSRRRCADPVTVKADRQLLANPRRLLAEHENRVPKRRVSIVGPIGELQPTSQQFNGRMASIIMEPCCIDKHRQQRDHDSALQRGFVRLPDPLTKLGVRRVHPTHATPRLLQAILLLGEKVLALRELLRRTHIQRELIDFINGRTAVVAYRIRRRRP